VANYKAIAVPILSTLALAQSLAGSTPLTPGEATAVISQMSGCFLVTFNYVEDGEHDAFYDPVYERADISVENPLTISRTLFVAGSPQKHWSETWVPLDERRWQQEVRGPLGDFRYRCEGVWLKNQWTCTADNSPKPRRDAARPYLYLNRQNTLQINPKRWVHIQVNTKLSENHDLYSTESGWNLYERAPDAHCQAGR